MTETQDQPGGDDLATRLFFSHDVLVITVLLSGPYPSVNHTGADGFRGGRKSAAYRTLYNDVLTLGQLAVDRGWRKIDDPAQLTITRYATTRAPRDAINIGVAECNALTEAGVWTDDALAPSVHSNIVVDPSGPDRIVIILQRLTATTPNPRVAAAKRRTSQPLSTERGQPARSGRTAYIDGKAVPYEDAIALLHETTLSGGRRKPLP